MEFEDLLQLINKLKDENGKVHLSNPITIYNMTFRENAKLVSINARWSVVTVKDSWGYTYILEKLPKELLLQIYDSLKDYKWKQEEIITITV